MKTQSAILSSAKPQAFFTHSFVWKLFLAGALFFFSKQIRAQHDGETLKDEHGYLLPGIIVEGDTLAMIHLNTVTISAPMKFASKKHYEQWDRLKYNVKKAYPYALIAAARLREYENLLKTMPDEEHRKTLMAVAEKQLKKEFEGQLKQLTVKQGRILIKLIDRETGRTSYELVKQLRGNFNAWMWQSFASLFGSSLKSEYDPKGEDRLIELAIQKIEAGEF